MSGPVKVNIAKQNWNLILEEFNKNNQAVEDMQGNVDGLTSQMADKASQTSVNAKADKTYVDTELAKKANQTDVTLKADKSYVDSQIQNMSSNVQGFYATVSTLTTAFPSGNANNYVVTADNYIYRWNGSAWASTGYLFNSTSLADGTITTSKYADGSVSPVKTTFISEGVNKFNIADHGDATRTVGSFIQNGSLIANANYDTTNPIYLKPNTQYSLNRATWGSASAGARGSMFNASGTFIGAWDNLTQTTPANFAYVRFTIYKVTQPSIDDLMIVEGTTIPSSFVGYSLQLNNNINLPIDVYRYPMFVKRAGNTISVASKYNKTNDLQVTISPVGQSSLPQISKLDLKPNTNAYVLNDFSGLTNIVTLASDLVGPYKVLAKANIDGDKLGTEDFTGGWHGWNGDQTGAKTANNYKLDLVIDGVLNNADGTYGATEVKVNVVNGIYASNTKKTDGTGREVLKEYITYTFKADGKIEVEVRTEILEDVSMRTYYGMQLTMDTYFKGKLLFVGDNLQTKWLSPANQDVSCGNKSQSFCDTILLTNNNNYFEGKLDRFGIGNKQYISSTDSVAFAVSYNKAYFRLVNWIDFASGSVLNWSGKYKFYYKE